jgi:hypothetical protein
LSDVTTTSVTLLLHRRSSSSEHTVRSRGIYSMSSG